MRTQKTYVEVTRLGKIVQARPDSRGVSKTGFFPSGYSAEHYVYEGMEGGDSVLGHRRNGAPELGCVALKRTLKVNTPGVSTGATAIEIEQINPGDPPPEYFTVPEDYSEYTPSESLQNPSEGRRKGVPAMRGECGPAC